MMRRRALHRSGGSTAHWEGIQCGKHNTLSQSGSGRAYSGTFAAKYRAKQPAAGADKGPLGGSGYSERVRTWVEATRTIAETAADIWRQISAPPAAPAPVPLVNLPRPGNPTTTAPPQLSRRSRGCHHLDYCRRLMHHMFLRR